MLEEKLDALAQRMAEHMARPFPPGCRGLSVESQDMVLLDADAYGLVAGVHEGALGERHREGLARLAPVFAKVLPAIEDEYAAEYYTHVRDMTALAAEIESLREK
ncbi:hypothetical protein ACPB9E_02810 [Streptomyces exfoliatus]|uniref:hypothetical protein n=1 Tax=Streptomyces exfoliatus TaxID=1905 RepID=UPI003C307E57